MLGNELLCPVPEAGAWRISQSPWRWDSGSQVASHDLSDEITVPKRHCVLGGCTERWCSIGARNTPGITQTMHTGSTPNPAFRESLLEEWGTV